MIHSGQLKLPGGLLRVRFAEDYLLKDNGCILRIAGKANARGFYALEAIEIAVVVFTPRKDAYHFRVIRFRGIVQILQKYVLTIGVILK
jgi:hypothetical protein